MIDEDDSELSDIDPEEMARLVQDVDDLDADMFGLKVTKPKANAIKSSGPSLKILSPTPKATETLSGKSRLLAEMFPARSDWLGLQDEPKEAAVPTATPLSPRAQRRSRDTAPIVTSTAIETSAERPKFMPTPRRPRTGPPDPLGLFQDSQGGQPDSNRTDPALPSWLGGVQTPTFLQAAPRTSPSRNNSVQEQFGSSLQPYNPSNSLEQPRQPCNLVEATSQISTDPSRQFFSVNQPQQITNNLDPTIKGTTFLESSKDADNTFRKTEPSNSISSLPQQLSNVIAVNTPRRPTEQATNPDQSQPFTNFHYEPKNSTNIQDQLLKAKPSQDHTLQSNSLSELRRLSADTSDISRQPSAYVDILSQSKSPQESYKAPPPIQQDSFQRPTIDRHSSDGPSRRNDSLPPSPRQSNLGNQSDRWYPEDYNSTAANRNLQMDNDEYRRDRDRDRRLERDLRLDLESRHDRDSRLERLLETLVSRSTADAQLDGQRMRRELDMLAASLRDEMAALAGSRRRDALVLEAAQGEQRDMAKSMDTLGEQLKGLAEALAEHRQSWQRDTAALQAALAQRSEPTPVQQVPANQPNFSNFEFQDKRVNLQQDALSLHASQAYFAQDVKQEIRSTFKEMQQEVTMADKLSRQSRQEFIEKVERERALFAEEMNQGRDLLLREMKRREEGMAERIDLELTQFKEEKTRQRSEFAKVIDEARQQCFETIRKERIEFTEMLIKERSNFQEELKKERTTFLAMIQENRDMMVSHTSTEMARFSDQLAQSSSALAAEMRHERDGLVARETALAERESEVRWRNESLASAAKDLQRMTAAAVDARDQGNAALSAAERIEGRECERAAELSAQLAQLRDMERARVARRLAKASQHPGIDSGRSPTEYSWLRMQARHDIIMDDRDQLQEYLCSLNK